MKAFVIFIAISFSTLAQAENGKNAAAHMIASAGLTAGMYLVMTAMLGREEQVKGPSLIGAATMALAAGLAKESMDSMLRRDRRLDAKDLTADVVGVAAATGFILIIDF